MSDGSASATDDRVEERLFAGYSGRLLWLTAVGAMVSILGQFVFPLVLPRIIDELGISAARAGFIITVIWVFTAVFRYPGGRLADQLSRKTVLVAGIGFAIGGLGLIATSVGYGMLLVGAAGLGVGLGLYFPAALIQISDLFIERRGQAMGIHIGLVNVGGALASGLVLAVLAVAPWRATFLPLILALAVVVALTHAWNAQPYVLAPSRISLDLVPTSARLLRTPGMPLAVVLLAVYNVTFQGFVNFLPTFLVLEKGLSPAVASGAFATFFLVGAVTNPVAGRLGDRFDHPTVAAAAAGVTALGLTGVVLTESVPGLLLWVVVVGSASVAVWPVMTAYVMDLLPTRTAGGDFGALSTLYILIGAIGPTYVGVIAGRFDYATAYATLVGGLLLAVGIGGWLSWRY